MANFHSGRRHLSLVLRTMHRMLFTGSLAVLSATLADADAVVLAEDRYDALGGGFNPVGEELLSNSYLVPSSYALAGVEAFESATDAQIPPPASGQEFLGVVPWAIADSDEHSPLNNVFEAGTPLPELYIEYEYFVPAGFPLCGGKWLRGGLQDSVFIGNWFSLETPPSSTSNFNARWLFQLNIFGPNDSYLVSTTTATVRDRWQKVGLWIRYNTFTSTGPNRDGFARLFLDGVLEAEIESIVWLDTPHPLGIGFNKATFPLNMSYGVCGRPTETKFIWVAGVRVYNTYPGNPQGSIDRDSWVLY